MTTIAETLEAQLDEVTLRQLRVIAEVAAERGLQAYLVGGSVRDALLGLTISDIDVTAAGATPEFAHAIANALGGEVVAHSQFNTFALNIADKRIDLAMARRETYAHPGALPTVSPGSMDDDLARRDFTINAMAVSINPASWGDLLDPFDGSADLRQSIVRTLHDAGFRDDATRILRAVRYAVRLGFTLDTHTRHLLRRDLTHLGAISGARIRHEFERIFRERRAVSTLDVMQQLGVMRVVHPALALDPHTLEALRRAADHPYADKTALFLSILAYGMSARDKAVFTERLRLTSRLAHVVQDTGAVRNWLQEFKRSTGEISRSEVYMRLREFSQAAILGCALFDDGAATQRLTLFLRELRYVKPILNGNDLLELGVPQGAQIGELLHDLLVARLDEKVKTRGDEISLVLARLNRAAGS